MFRRRLPSIALIIFFTIGLIISFIYRGPAYSQQDPLLHWMIERAKYVNKYEVRYKQQLALSDKITDQQALNRCLYIFNYAYNLNYMFPTIHPRQVVKDYFAIMEYETRFVNYYDLDGGQSVGVVAMKLTTARWIATIFDEQFYENEFRNNVKKQIKYGIWYYYHLLEQNWDEVKPGTLNKLYKTRMASITEYNTGPGINPNLPRWRNYPYSIAGRIQDHAKQIEEFVKISQEE